MQIRPISRADLYDVANVLVFAGENDSITGAVYPHQQEYPVSMFNHRLRFQTWAFAQNSYKGFVAIADEDDLIPGVDAGTIVGCSWWRMDGDDSYKGDKNGVFWILERTLQNIQGLYAKWFRLNAAADPMIQRKLNSFHKGSNGFEVIAKTSHWYLAALAVISAAQGRGIGKALLSWGLEQARNNSDPAQRIVALHGTPVGRWLYEKNGFRQVGSLEGGPFAFRLPDCLPHVAMLWDPSGYWTMPRDGRGPEVVEAEKLLGYEDYVLYREPCLPQKLDEIKLSIVASDSGLEAK